MKEKFLLKNKQQYFKRQEKKIKTFLINKCEYERKFSVLFMKEDQKLTSDQQVTHSVQSHVKEPK